jgi:argonaute-like protein implicated in RNA metabolism and viral defense
VFNADILPDLNKSQHKQILLMHGVRFDLERESKQRALSLTAGASRERAENTIRIVGLVAEELFPLSWNGIRVSLQKNAITLTLPLFDVHESLEEPVVEFRDNHQTSNIADGLTRYGSVKQVGEPIQIVVVCTRDVEQKMDALLQAIQKGSRSYRGADRTFGTRFEVGKRVVTKRPEDYLVACQSIVSELEQGKRWIFLVYAPEQNYSRADYDSPYYKVKRYLLEVGFPSQMVKEATVENPDWKDLNLALNIIAKAGIAPWVLSKQLAQADCFIGLSYSVIHSRRGLARLFGYANVFNSFGQWKFYKGSAQDYSFDERERYTAELVEQTLREYERTVSVQDVHIHSSVRLSRRVREAIIKAAREVRRDITLHFAHINTTHPVRLYDQNPQGDGSLPRGTFVITSPNQFYLSTTGYNTVQKSLGTPIMIEANVRTNTANGEIAPSLEIFAQHLLSLTKLNWASTRYFCHEPITTKYAGDIAYLMTAFLSSESPQPFKLNPRLESTPWFL